MSHVQSRCQTRMPSLRLDSGQRILFKLIHMTVGRRFQFFTTQASQWAFNNMTSSRANDLRKMENFQDGSLGVLYNLCLKVTYHHFCCVVLFAQTNPGTIPGRRRLSKVVNIQRQDHLEPSQGLGQRPNEIWKSHQRLPLHMHLHPQIDKYLEPNQLLRYLEPRKNKASHDISRLIYQISFFPLVLQFSRQQWYRMCSLNDPISSLQLSIYILFFLSLLC